MLESYQAYGDYDDGIGGSRRWSRPPRRAGAPST